MPVPKFHWLAMIAGVISLFQGWIVSKFRQAFRDSSLFHLYKSITARGEYAPWKLRALPGADAPRGVD
jgi:hypothetical protein